MATPQHGIFAQGTRSHYHLELDLRPGSDPAAVGRALAGLREPTVTAGGLNLVVGLGPDLCRALAPDAIPDALRPFETVEGPNGRAPSTQHDVWVWLHGTGPDVLLDAARAVVAVLAPVADLALEQPAFVYLDSRDLTGFIDGTENPPVEEAEDVACVPAGEVGEGGSYVMTMKWIHDLEAFHALDVAEQEAVIGRTKPDSVERDDKPPTAHISRVVIEEDGEELEIYRRSVPYGTVEEHGLYFIAFSADLSRFEKMLARMFDATGDGVHDRLIDFTRAASGSFYFAPSLEQLAAVLPA